MIKSPNQVKKPELRSSKHSRFFPLNRNIIGLSVLTLLISFAGGAWWLWIFIYEQLAPLVEKNLTQMVNRPVQLGQVQQFSLTSLQFSKSSVPVTSTDPDKVSVDAVEVAFDPLQLVFSRTLNLDVTLVNPNIYIEQDNKGRWVSTTLAAQDNTGPVRTNLDKIRFRNANVVLVANNQARGNLAQPKANSLPQNKVSVAPGTLRVGINQVNGVAQFLENNQVVQFDIAGQMVRGGSLALQGQYRPSTEQANLQIRTQNLLASDVTRLIPLPLDLQAGRVNGNLNVQLRKEQQADLFGTAMLNSVTAQINQLPQRFVNSQGTLRFKGKQVQLDNVQTSYGKIPLVASGTLDTVGEYNIKARVPNVTLANARDTLNLQLPVTVTGVATADASLTGPILQPILSGTVVTTKPARIDRVDFSNIKSGFVFSTAASEIAFKDIQATPTVGGQITGSGKIKLGQKVSLGFDVVAKGLPGDALARLYNVSPQIKIGTVSATTQISGTSVNPQTIVNWQAPQATYPAQGKIVIADLNTLFFPNTVLNVAGGTVQASGQLVNNRWQASVQANRVELGRITQVPQALREPLTGTLNLSGTLASFQPETITATGSGRLNVADGTVTASNIQLTKGQWQTQLRVNGVELDRLVQAPLPGALAGEFNLSGTLASFQPETIRGTGQGRLNVAGGTVTASNIRLARGQWQALVSASQVQLNQFSQQLQGQLSGQLRLAGTVNSFDLAAIRAAGNVRFSQGIGLLEQPLSAVVGWDGEKVIVQQATTPSLKANGLIFAKVSGTGAPEITNLNLNVQAQNYNLQDLPFQLPNAVDLTGRADFTGRVSGTLPTPDVVGSLRLRNLAVNNFAFDPVLTGNVEVATGRGVQLEVTGAQDRIALNLDSNYRPVSFLVRLDQAVAQGKAQQDNLLVNVENFPLNALNLKPSLATLGPSPIAGVLTGDFQVNQAQSTLVGNLAIAEPALGSIKGDRFVGGLRYGNGSATLEGGEFIIGESRYYLAGSFTQTPNGPQVKGQVNITQGQVQDVLTALQFFELQDFGRGLQPPSYGEASDLRTTSVGLPETALLTQLRRFSEIEVLLQQQRQQSRDTLPLPELADLGGTFNGEISLNGSLQNGIAVNFDLEGKNWKWGSYNAETLIAQGSFENGVLTLLPLRIESDQTLLAFNGQVGETQQSGQLQLRNFPVDQLDNFVSLPVELTGELNATATLAGNIQNPQAIGELNLVKGTLNQKAIDSALGSFSYSNARLNFSSNVTISGPSPIDITGSVPVQLPFASVTPDSNQISLNVNLQNEELALLNLLTNQVAWQDGQGQVQLQVRGTLQQPVATGIATVDNATITAAALPEPLTEVTGTVRFNLDRIQVENLQGKFSDGKVAAQGVIPVFKNLSSNDPDSTNPLTVTLDRLALNLEGLYQGGASGNVAIAGSVFNPVIGGEVRLDQGNVLISEAANASTPSSSGGTGTPAQVNNQIASANDVEPSNSNVPEFNNLRLTLGNNIEIVRPPLLNFQATGNLTLNGTRNDIRPDGTIRLSRGSINLFTTQFVLARGYEHTATFNPERELDPILDIRLVAVVPEVTQRRVPSSPVSSEIAQTLSTDLGALKTVRVQARVTGPASQLFDNLELTSDPARSQSEIIALIGGGFIDTLGRGDIALGFANFAGSALFNSFQGSVTSIGNTLGLSELRIFPTVTTEERSDTSALGLAAEAGIDISPNVYFSLSRVLTTQQPTRFGVVYRINDQLRVRSTTDLSGYNGTMVEYENRF